MLKHTVEMVEQDGWTVVIGADRFGVSLTKTLVQPSVTGEETLTVTPVDKTREVVDPVVANVTVVQPLGESLSVSLQNLPA